jgi:phage/plasmid-like protein (TIGR03299 family)
MLAVGIEILSRAGQLLSRPQPMVGYALITLRRETMAISGNFGWDSVGNYKGATPWTDIGTYVGEEGLLTKEALQATDCLWTVSKRPLFTTSDAVDIDRLDGVPYGSHRLEEYRAIVRDTDNTNFGIVKKNYHLFQNEDMAVFADELVGDGSLRIHTAGELNGGRQVWLLGKVGSTEIVPNDKIDHYLFLYTGHDGSTAFRCVFTTVRVVCANTASVALQQARGEGVSIRHTKNMSLKTGEARRVLGISQKAFEESDDFMRKLADIPMPQSDWIDFCMELFPTPEEDADGNVSKRAVTRTENNRSTLTSLYVDGRGSNIPGVRGTAWGAYNALTEFAGYHRTTRGDQSKRFESLMMGSGAQFIRNGASVLRELV